MTVQPELYTIRSFTYPDMLSQPISMEEIVSGEIDGFIINDFLNGSEVNDLLKGFRNVSESDLIHIEKGFDSYPMSFAQFDQMVQKRILTEEDYFNHSRNYISTFQHHFGVNIVEKLNTVFKCIQNSPEITIPVNRNETEPYVPFTFRELFPGEGCLKAHCENLFFREFPSFFTRINSFSTPDNQLSFFIVLQKPQRGGELTLFDIIWDGNQTRMNDHQIRLEDDIMYEFDDAINLKRNYYHPPVGSLVVFSGGKIWHRVENVMSAPSRITLGGFLSFSHDKRNLYTWS